MRKKKKRRETGKRETKNTRLHGKEPDCSATHTRGAAPHTAARQETAESGSTNQRIAWIRLF
jgi:hypothetical protein